jgi:hypothetical protein
VADAVEWWKRLRAFYRWMNDEKMVDLADAEVDRLSRRNDAHAAVRLGTIKHIGCARSV